ncbi:MAG: hypothetical protein HOI23_05875 [Deltaproteobacteria bacterium]|nr:hypothetical protein [Deltaproteobacteria bacterium]
MGWRPHLILGHKRSAHLLRLLTPAGLNIQPVQAPVDAWVYRFILRTLLKISVA